MDPEEEGMEMTDVEEEAAMQKLPPEYEETNEQLKQQAENDSQENSKNADDENRRLKVSLHDLSTQSLATNKDQISEIEHLEHQVQVRSTLTEEDGERQIGISSDAIGNTDTSQAGLQLQKDASQMSHETGIIVTDNPVRDQKTEEEAGVKTIPKSVSLTETDESAQLDVQMNGKEKSTYRFSLFSIPEPFDVIDILSDLTLPQSPTQEPRPVVFSDLASALVEENEISESPPSSCKVDTSSSIKGPRDVQEDTYSTASTYRVEDVPDILFRIVRSPDTDITKICNEITKMNTKVHEIVPNIARLVGRINSLSEGYAEELGEFTTLTVRLTMLTVDLPNALMEANEYKNEPSLFDIMKRRAIILCKEIVELCETININFRRFRENLSAHSPDIRRMVTRDLAREVDDCCNALDIILDVLRFNMNRLRTASATSPNFQESSVIAAPGSQVVDELTGGQIGNRVKQICKKICYISGVLLFVVLILVLVIIILSPLQQPDDRSIHYE